MIKQNFLKSILCLLMGIVCNVAWAQAVIFPQAQQPGTAKVETVSDGYTIGNDLFTAKFVKVNNTLKFGGCEELGLLAGTEIFKVELRDGTEIPASQFTMGEVVTEVLAGDPKAAKGAKRLPGQQIKGTFTHSNGLAIEWRAVLRDGSHYLRTEMDIKNPGTVDIAMNSITPMMYTVQNVDGEKAPAVVGNTRGAVIASDKIFAGVETPTAYNMAGEATDLDNFAFKGWTGEESFTWTPEDNEIPQGIKNLTEYGVGSVVGSRGYVIFREAGSCTITIDYTGQNDAGNKALHILGVEILSLDGTLVSSNYHYGKTGTTDSNNSYTVDIPNVGCYMVRYFISTKTEPIASKGDIIYSLKVAQPELVYDLASTETPYYTSSNDQNNATAAVHLSRATATRALSAATIASGATITDSWATASWTAAQNVPQEILGMGYTKAQVVSVEQALTMEAAGTLDVTFTWRGGSHRLDLVGVDLVDSEGNVVSGDYNRQDINSSAPAKYSVIADKGTYTLRYFVETKTETVDSNGDISIVHTALPKLNAESTSAQYQWDTRNNNWSAFTDWTGTLPESVNNPGTAKYIDHCYAMGVGFVAVEFDYSESIAASHKINTLGVQLIDLKGNVVSSDFRNDASGTNTKATYKVVAPKEGVYILRSIVCRTSGDYNTAGDTNISFEAMAIKSITGENGQQEVWESNLPGYVDWDGTLPDGVTKQWTAQYRDTYYAVKAGKLSLTFDFNENGGHSHALYVLGVQLIDLNHNVVSSHFKNGKSGTDTQVTYTVKALKDGVYTVRHIVDKGTNDGKLTGGNIALSLVETKVLGTIGEDETLADAWRAADWKTLPEADVPNRVNEAGCTDANARVIEQQITINAAGVLSVEFKYEGQDGGGNKLNLVGVDLLDANGQVAVDDYHAGSAGGEHVNNVYKLNIFAPGTYTIRYFANNGEVINSKGNINLKLTVDYTLHLVAAETTPISGKWSRVTTLKAGEEWNIGAVVGVIAPGQARRSFLAYSERERAVPWRAVPAYISWYEININRNNAAPGSEHENFTEEDCLPILTEWKKQLYDVYHEAPYAFVWDDGWDTYGEWQFHSGFPNGFTNMDNIGRQMGAGQGAWLGPVGGYGTSGGYRRNYWNSTKTGGMQLSNPAYYEVFVNAVTGLLKEKGYDFRFFKFDGISSQFSSVGPDPGATGNENAEAIIMAEKVLRSIKEDVFLNTTVGTWASPFWFQHTDAIWRQEKDDGTIGNNSNNRENWITYRDRLVYQNYVQNSPLCPINTLMTHGFIFTDFGGPAGFSREWNSVLNELRCAFACGSGMVELYNDYKLTNELVNPATGNAGELWGEIAKCMQWQRKNADVLPDIHWVGGNPWTGAKAEVYGWAAWNGQKAVLTLRNGANDAQEFTFTLREVLEIPEYITSSTITFTKAFDDQVALTGFAEGEQLDIDAKITVTVPGSSVYVFDGSEKTVKVESISLSTENDVTEVPANKTLKVNAVVTPADANQSLTWTSSKTEVATVANGIITPVKEGEVTITATAKDGSGVSKSITITVTPRVYTLAVLGTDNNGAGASYGDKQYANGASLAMDFDLSELHANAIDGMMAMVNVLGETIYISYMPANTQFYTIKNGHGGYVSLAPDYCDEDGYLKLTNSSSIKDRRGLWAFVGNSTDGYKIYNYTTGLSKVLGITGSEADARATMIAEGAEGYTTAFDGSIKLDGTDGRIKLKGSTNNYWNMRGDYLALWNDNAATGNDTGSQFFMTAVDFKDFVDEILPIVPEIKEELDASLIKSVTSFTPENANTLWYTTSAQATGVTYPWMEYALPLGNGELGCMVFGGVLKEELQFNEKTLWSGPANVVGATGGKRTFMNFGSVFVKNLDETLEQGVTDYVRYLDIEEGIAGVKFTNANGTKQERKYLSSAPDQVIAAQYRITEGSDKLHLLFKLEAEADIDADYVRNDANVNYEEGMASFTGYMESVNYAARLHVVAKDGEVITTNAGIEVKNATEVTFYLKGATNFDGDMQNTTSYFTTATPAQVNASVMSVIEAAADKGFETIKTAHVEDFKAITERMTLDLGLTTPTVDTKTLIDNYYPNNTEGTSTSNDHLFLEQLYFHYGRYLAISSNRKNIAAPNNLQGIWNDRTSDSPWNSDIHTNINIQMNYWPTEITNLSDLHKPFVNFIIRGAQTEGWKQVGTKYNDGHGWSILTETSLYGSMSTWGDHYLVANVWYTSHLWMHYRYTQDKEFLKEAFPAMWGAAEFWFHRLIEDRGFDNTLDEQESVRNYHTPYKYEADGTFVAPNEFSAEQHDNEREDGTAHAQQMIYYLFTNIKEAIDILGGKEAVGLTDEDIAKLDLYLEETDQGLHTETYTGAWGETYNGVKTGELLLREWKYTPFDISNDKGHRHMSHLMALFPMDQITPESPYFEPAVNSLKLRGDAATGWSMGWKVNLWARAQDGDHAHLIIKNALKHSTSYGTNAGAGGIYYNLFDSHAPFQIDGNFGVCSGMAEMLMQSAHGYINILPALPAVWERTGAVTGMKAIGNFTVDFNWQNGKAQQVTIVSNADAPLKVRCNRGAMDIADALVTVNGTEVAAQVDENGIATIPNVKEGDKVVIDFTKRHSVAVKVYTPGARVTTLEAGKKYFIYNTCFNGSEDRTGFLYDSGSSLGHTGEPKKKPSAFKTTLDTYLWEVETTDEEGKYYLKAADGGYANASGKTDNATTQVLYIQPWNTSTATKAGVKSEGEDGTVIENANIGGDVFTISGTKVGNTGQDCWNGNPNGFAKWESAHPYAFYEVAEYVVMLNDKFPLPGRTYYIYCDNDTRQYFYNDGGTLKVSEKRTEWSNEYLFTCSFDGQYFQFKNMKGKYLKHQGLQDAAHNFELAEYLDGVNLKTSGLSSGYFVMKNDNTFSQANRGDYDPASTDFSTIYKFEEFNFPVDGETYYIYSDTYYNNEYVNRYMYADGGNLKLNTSLSADAAYQWTCIVTEDGKVQFKNGAGKYLAHKGIQDTPYNFTLNKYNANHAIAATLYSDAASRYFVVKSDGTGFNQSTNVETGDNCTDFVFMPVSDVKLLTVKGSTNTTGAKATWNDETKALPATWVITPHTTIADATLSVASSATHSFNVLSEAGNDLAETIEISSLDANRTITAKFTPAFFSTTYGEKWVRLQNCSNTSYWATVESTTALGNGKTATIDYADEKQLWCLVGTAENFVIYNKAAGNSLALNVPLAENATGYGDGNQALLSADQGTWKIIEQDFGYAFVPTVKFDSNTKGINMYGGNGGNLKLYGTGENNKGSYWVVEMADVTKPLTLNVTVDKVWDSSPRVAELTFTINGKSSTTRILGEVEAQALYLPAGATFSLSSMTYRGYTFNGFNEEDSYEDQTLSEGGMEITASYTANEERTLFYSPRDGHPYRIPAIATAPNGDIFAICDYRPCGGDIGNGDVDIVCRISSDNGVTWGDELVLANGDDGSTNRMETGYGDPAIVVDRESNKILVMMVAGRTVCGNSRWDASKIGVKDAAAVNRAARVYGTLNETTGEWEWTQPEEVTDDIYKLFLDESNTATVTSYFIGSGKICQSRVVKKGEFYRLYCALWTRDNGNRVIYSDDFGGSWHVLGTINDRPASGGDEPKCEELPDGTVILSSRKSGGRFFNIFTFDDDTYTTGNWGEVANSTSAYDGSNQGTNGEIYKVKAIRKSDGQICDVMLQSVPAGPGRSNVTVYYKEMDYTTAYTPATFAADWKVGKQVSQKGSAYSTMHLQADGRIAFFFEEEPSGYCMVYIPYTIEELTGDAYTLYNVNSTITEHGIGTFYASEAMKIPDGVKAYVATEMPHINGDESASGYLRLTELNDIIPAKTGVVLMGEKDTYNFIPSISYGAKVEGNMLVGFEASDNKAESSVKVTCPTDGFVNYVLAVENGVAAFYRKEADFKVFNNKAYLNVPVNAAVIHLDDDETTSIDAVDTEAQNAVIYDLSGRRAKKVNKGVYIVNGRKVIH